MTDNELLLAISNMLDVKLRAELKPLQNDIQDLKDSVTRINLKLDNVIVPRLGNIESCYTDTYTRYKNYGDQMQAVFEDIELLKKVVADHSEQLKQLA